MIPHATPLDQFYFIAFCVIGFVTLVRQLFMLNPERGADVPLTILITYGLMVIIGAPMMVIAFYDVGTIAFGFGLVFQILISWCIWRPQMPEAIEATMS